MRLWTLGRCPPNYSKLWAFLSQIIDFQDPTVHRRAILTDLLGRHLDVGSKTREEFIAGVRLVSAGTSERSGA